MKTGFQQLIEASSCIDHLCSKKNVQPQHAVQRFIQAFTNRRLDRQAAATECSLAEFEAYLLTRNNTETSGKKDLTVNSVTNENQKPHFVKAPELFDLNVPLNTNSLDKEFNHKVCSLQQSGAYVSSTTEGENNCASINIQRVFDLNELAESDNPEADNTVEGNAADERSDADETTMPTTDILSHTTEDAFTDEMLQPPEPNAAEVDMDNMFEEEDYPSINEVESAKEPHIGMIFQTREEAFYFFKVYARKMGFAVKKDASYKSRITGELDKQMFVCNRNGKPTCNDGPGRKRKSNVVENTYCKVLMRVKLEMGSWIVTQVHLEHNHELAQSKWLVRFMRCHKTMSESEKNFIGILQNSRIPPRKVMSIFRLLRGHLRCVGFDAKDVSNIQSKERMNHRQKDVIELLQLFKERQKEIPGFYYSVMSDTDGTVRSVFWTDALGIGNYKAYGDYVSFDTTFSTNLYDLPFAPIIGVNNHGKTILFGCALLKDQTIETFEWLFEAFLAANDGKVPKTIITDQDQAIASAIQSKFPMAVRRFCFWHIMIELKRKNRSFFKSKPNLYKELKYAVKNSFTIEEFENRWIEIIDAHQARENNRLNYLYNIRRYWVPAYFMGSFYPFSSTTGRSESTNALFKGYVSYKDSIVNFFNAYEQIQEKNLSALDRCRFNSEVKTPSKWSLNVLEKDASAIYTTAIFEKVQKEFRYGTAYTVKELVPGTMYQLKRITEYDNCEFEKEEYEVTVTEDKQHFRCSCAKLERDGIPCSHVLKIADRLNLLVIPESFIRYRWTKKADQEIGLQVGQHLTLRHGNVENSVQYCLMMAQVSDYCSSISGDKRAVEIFTQEFQKLKDTINSKLAEPQNSSGDQTTNTNNEGTANAPFKDPPIPMERGNKKRRKSIAEKKEKEAIAKAKRKAQDQPKKKIVPKCTECRSTLHNRKSCPEIGKMPQLAQVVQTQEQ